jgi:LPS-assembly protein
VRLLPAVAFILLGFALDSQAQAPPPSAHGGKRRPGSETRNVEEASEVRVRAESQGGTSDHYWFRGFVDLQAGENRIQADQLDFYRTAKPGGGTVQRVVAEGNVVFLRGEERLSGRHLEMDLDSGQGTFQDAFGYVQPGVFVEARTIHRLDADTYRIEGGKFTSCYQPNPRWSFQASSAKVEVDDKIIAKNVVFKVKEVPAFYMPIFMYPIQEDQRSTGFLFPHFGTSSARGFNIGDGFFWAMGRSFDQTFYADNYSDFGYGLGHELRYVMKQPSRGTFRSYGFKPKAGGDWDYDLDWNAVQMFPGRVRGTVQVRQYSNLSFQQRFQDSLDLASRRTRRSQVSLQRTFGRTTIRALADSLETFFPGGSRRNEHLPTVRVSGSPWKIGHSGFLFSYETRAEDVRFGNQDRRDKLSRFDLNPHLSRPFNISFLQINPEVQFRYTRYGASNDLEEETVTGPSLDRRFFEGNIELVGPTFSRVLDAPGNFYSERYKHTIGPEVRWTYRTRIDQFDLIPKFDGEDYYLGTDELNYALVQRLYAKRIGRSGKLEPYEFLNWRISQTYYVQIANNQNDFDPNFSSAGYGVNGQPDHNSPILSRVRFRPTPLVTTNFDTEYDVNFKLVRTLGLNTSINYSRFRLQGGWSRARRVAIKEVNRVLVRDTLRGSTFLQLLPGRLSLEGSADYDILRKHMIQKTGRLRYSVQCCGFTIEALQSDFNIKKDTQFRFSIELANIGSMGNFLGQDQTQATRSFGGLY